MMGIYIYTHIYVYKYKYGDYHIVSLWALYGIIIHTDTYIYYFIRLYGVMMGFYGDDNGVIMGVLMLDMIKYQMVNCQTALLRGCYPRAKLWIVKSKCQTQKVHTYIPALDTEI